ncbi:MAG: sulfotransferase [Phycisphaerales bacterium]
MTRAPMNPNPFAPVPKRVAAINNAKKAYAERNFSAMQDAIKPIVDAKKKDPEALFLMALAQEGMKNMTKAYEYAKQSAEIHDHPDVTLLMARCERFMGNTENCVRLVDKATAKRPDWVPALIIKGGALEAGGRFDESRAVLAPILERFRAQGEEPPHSLLTEWAKLQVQGKEYDEAIETIDHLIERHQPIPDAERMLLHLRAKACDRKKDFPESWESAVRANAISKIEFDQDMYTEQVSVLIENWSKENMVKFPVSKCDSEVPVFVAGMPRSGTSLIDQIIDAHPKAAGVGELATIEMFAKRLSMSYDPSKEPPACFGQMGEQKWTNCSRNYLREIQKKAPSAERIVNKALGNNKLVGLIAKLFPKTRIIHAVRDPRDVSISCYMGGFNNNMHAYTTQIDWTAHTWGQSVRMMEHWKRSLDVPILDVCYEQLVSDPDTQFPRIIEFLGLEWDDACREFHKSKRTVRTLSYDQVNRPIYTSSKGRHANYAEFIEDVEFPPYDPSAEDPLAVTRDWISERYG